MQRSRVTRESFRKKKPRSKLKFRSVFCQITFVLCRLQRNYSEMLVAFSPVMTNCWINVLVNIMYHDRWNYHNPEYSPIIIILKFNRTNPVSGNRKRKGCRRGGEGREREKERERWTKRENLRAWERWLNISFIRNRCWMAGFYRFRLPPRKMAAIFTFYNSPLFVQHGTTTTHDISYIFSL